MNQYDVAPLEGITGYVFRNVHHRYFPGVRKYYIPFIEPKPKAKKIFTGREMGDILPEHKYSWTVPVELLDFRSRPSSLIYNNSSLLNISIVCFVLLNPIFPLISTFLIIKHCI